MLSWNELYTLNILNTDNSLKDNILSFDNKCWMINA